MEIVYFSAGRSILEVKKEQQEWTLHEKITPNTFLCLAADPNRPGLLYGGTFNDGLWVSRDSGDTWHPAGAGITHKRIMSVAVSPIEVKNDMSVVWAGTEPSGLFRSEDGGNTWTDCPSLLDLPSRPSWSFPPRPHTHHVRWIQTDHHNENRIFVGIELGGVMKSEDKGAHWEDRKPNSQYDCHSMAVHPRVSGRVYEAAGGGYAESFDGGTTWQTVNEGLRPYNYLISVAVDPADADTVVASASKSPYEAYNPERANTIVVRRKNGGPWARAHEGLPDADGSAHFALASHVSRPGVFYAVNNLGMFISYDAGQTWNKISIEWPEHVKTKRIPGFTMIAGHNEKHE
ncbi:hypothetical protein [Sinobaca sp. H24]|uniref:WD40/YVTN/BNR-like repeat-containing protein n=1 Tax=Sinobaca sp. H24 TaxID=2923376 RepID=UPI00207A0279|nr:hypothetical protein [Sinobaca sp. H24]